MLCPVCKSAVLEDKELEDGLRTAVCPVCSGSWIRYPDYEEWKNNDHSNIDIGNFIIKEEGSESKKACLCPDCGRIMIKHRVSAGLPFSIDHCNSCGGIWLYKGEWESIVASGLHLRVNEFFTSEWQDSIREEMTRMRLEEKYKARFGKENYLKLKEIREWIRSDVHKDEIIAYLIDDDPYKV